MSDPEAADGLEVISGRRANTPGNDKCFQNRAEQWIPMDQLKCVERFNGRAAMFGIVIGILTEAITGSGIAHQIGLGARVEGDAACPRPVPALLLLSCFHSAPTETTSEIAPGPTGGF